MSYQQSDVSVDDPRVSRAMRLYDEILTDDEKRNVYHDAVRAAVAAEQEGYYGNRLTQWAESVNGFILRYSHQNYREAVRAAKDIPPARYEDGVDVEDLIAGLRAGGGV